MPTTLAPFVSAFRARWQFPGLSVAVARSGEPLETYTTGFADPESARPVTPETLFRIASLSKTITAVAILRLAEQQVLALDAPALAYLPHIPSSLPDPRLARLTIRQILHHTAGWDESLTPPPFAATHDTVLERGWSFPPAAAEWLAALLAQPLDFEPGTRHAYSNSGYFLLGRLIEHVTRQSYEDAVRNLVLAPAGLTHVRLGRSLPQHAAPQEAAYFAGSPEPVLSIFSREPRLGPAPYAAHVLENIDSAGGWIATPSDLVRFLQALDPAHSPSLWNRPSSFAEFTTPSPCDPSYGLGIVIEPEDDGTLTLLHNGGFDGCYAFMATFGPLGLSLAVLVNTDRDDEDFEPELIGGLLEILK